MRWQPRPRVTSCYELRLDPYSGIVECVDCGGRWCLVCEEHWEGCRCPGPHDEQEGDDDEAIPKT